MVEIACFISPHGFGHATRAIAVVEALQLIRPHVHANFFTTVPKSLFAQTLTNFTYHAVVVDVGLVQSSALDCDIPATIRRLDELQPYSKEAIEELAALCAGCSLVLCDIAPLGITVAQSARCPSILVENFTWDWIYRPYVKKYPQLYPHARFLKKLFHQADYRIQTEPVCNPAPRDLHCQPIFRRAKGSETSLKKNSDAVIKNLLLSQWAGFFSKSPLFRVWQTFPTSIFCLPVKKRQNKLGRTSLSWAMTAMSIIPIS